MPPSPHSLSCGFPRARGEQGTALAVDSPSAVPGWDSARPPGSSEMYVAKMKGERKMRRWERNEEFSEAGVAVELFPELNIDP